MNINDEIFFDLMFTSIKLDVDTLMNQYIGDEVRDSAGKNLWDICFRSIHISIYDNLNKEFFDYD
jgi:hypothetical protein